MIELKIFKTVSIYSIPKYLSSWKMLYLIVKKKFAFSRIICQKFIYYFLEKNLANNLFAYPIPIHASTEWGEISVIKSLREINFLNACRNSWKFGAAVSNAHDWISTRRGVLILVFRVDRSFQCFIRPFSSIESRDKLDAGINRTIRNQTAVAHAFCLRTLTIYSINSSFRSRVSIMQVSPFNISSRLSSLEREIIHGIFIFRIWKISGFSTEHQCSSVLLGNGQINFSEFITIELLYFHLSRSSRTGLIL